MEQSVPRAPIHWKFPTFILICLLLSLSGSLYLLIHNRDPQIMMNQIAREKSGRSVDKKSVIALSADSHGDQVVLGFTRDNRLIVQLRQRVLGGYSAAGYHISSVSQANANRPYQLKNRINQKHINNFTYGALKAGQPAPRIKGKKISLISHRGNRIFYAFTSPNEKVSVQFNS